MATHANHGATTSGVYHVQRAVCHLVRRESSAIKFGRAEMASILAVGREETGAPGENPRRGASENGTYKTPKIQASAENRTDTVTLVTDGC